MDENEQPALGRAGGRVFSAEGTAPAKALRQV